MMLEKGSQDWLAWAVLRISGDGGGGDEKGLREGEETECPDVEARTVRNSGSLHRPSLRRVAGTQHALRDGSGEDHAPPLPRLSAIRHSALSWLTKT